MRALKGLLAIFVVLVCGQVHSELVFAGREARLQVADASAQFIVNSSLNNFCGTLQRGVVRDDQLQGSSIISFKDGKIEDAKMQEIFSGTFDPTMGDSIKLLGNNSVSFLNGPVTTPVLVSGAGNRIDGVAIFSQDIVLADAQTSVDIALVTPLNRSVFLNGGTVALGLDLDLIQDATLCGDGTIDCRGNCVRLNQRAVTWGGNIAFKNIGGLLLRGPTVLAGAWAFTADSKVSVIQGDNNILDLTTTGSLMIEAGSELVLVNVVLRGLGANGGRILFGDAKSRLTLVGCVVEMNMNYVFSSGQIALKDQDSLAVVGENSITFAGTSSLILDGVNFVYDALTASNNAGINVEGRNLVASSGGKILARAQDANGPAMLFSHRSNVLLKSEALSQNRTISFGLTGADPVSLDGSGFALRFPQRKDVVLEVADGQTIVFTNIVLENFYPEHISFGIGSQVIFGDNVFIELAGDASLDYEMVFNGNATLNGGGAVLTLTDNGKISAGSGKNLRLTDIVVRGVSATGGQIVHKDASAVITCVDVDLQIDTNYAFNVGTVVFTGTYSQVVTGPNALSFVETGKLVVDGVSLFYDTLTAPDLNNIRPSVPDGIFFSAVNGGKIRGISSLEKEGDLFLDLSSNVLNQDEVLNINRRMVFRGNKSLENAFELDGAGFAVQMPRSRSNVIVVPDGKSVVLKNLVLRDIAPEHIQLGASASLTFGDGVLLQLSEDCVLNSAWNFCGNVVIDGRYKNLDLSACDAGIVVVGASLLKIINANLVGLSAKKLLAVDVASSIQLVSSVLQLNGDCSFASGSLVMTNDVYLQGANRRFSFESSGSFMLKNGANLHVEPAVSLYYDNPHGDKGRFVFEDDSSQLFLHDANLISGSSGLKLDKGTLMVFGTSRLDGIGMDEAHALSISEVFNVKVQSGATLDLVGSVVYE